MKKITQWVVETSNKRSHWGWETYFKKEKEARRNYETKLNNKTYSAVRIYKQTFKAGA